MLSYVCLHIQYEVLCHCNILYRRNMNYGMTVYHLKLFYKNARMKDKFHIKVINYAT